MGIWLAQLCGAVSAGALRRLMVSLGREDETFVLWGPKGRASALPYLGTES